jgi:hypothetical protein
MSVKCGSDDLTDLIAALRHRGFWLYRWGDPSAPDVLAMVRRWVRRPEVDVILLRGERSASAYRTRYLGDWELFRPTSVHWQYHTEYVDPAQTFRALYALPAPDDPKAPDAGGTPSSLCRLPDDLPSPLVLSPLGTWGSLGQLVLEADELPTGGVDG